MARSKIPNPLDRRHLLEKELPAAQAQAIADAYLAEDRCVEAVAFLAKAEAGERLTELRKQARAEGDVFLLRAVAEAEGKGVRTEEWETTAEAAEKRGLERYAVEARRQAELGEE